MARRCCCLYRSCFTAAAERVRRTIPGTEGLRNYEVPVAPTTVPAPTVGPSTLRAPARAEISEVDHEDDDSDLEITSETVISTKAATDIPTRPTEAAAATNVPTNSPETADNIEVPMNPVEAADTADNIAATAVAIITAASTPPSVDMDTVETSATPPPTTHPLLDENAHAGVPTASTPSTLAPDSATTPVPTATGSQDDAMMAPPNAPEATAVVSEGAVPDISFLTPTITSGPHWLHTAAKHLVTLSSDTRWRALLKRFVEFEKSLGFLDGKVSD